MHATQPQGGACPEPHGADHASNFFVDLFGDDEKFRAWIATASQPVIGPPETGSVGYELTDAGRAALKRPDLKSMTQQEFCRWANPAADAGQPAEWPPGWCEVCGRALPWECSWQEPLCCDCVIVVSGGNGCGSVVTGSAATLSTAAADPVTEADDETPGQMLRSAALYLERHGWIQGVYYDATSGSFTPPACLVGAIGMVCYGGPVDAPAQHFDDPGFLDFEQALLHLDRYLLAEDGRQAYEFNDAKGRTVEQVTDVLRRAAARTADELVDALRAINAKNADLAELVKLLIPCGIWGETTVQQPADASGCSTCDPGCTEGYGCVRNNPAAGPNPRCGRGWR